jgi:predicted phosphodiesterase
MTNIIAIGDTHFKISNIPECELFTDKLIELVKNKKPDIIILLGDILDTFEIINTMPMNKAIDLIDKLRNEAPTYILVGNHDYCFAKNTPILLYDGKIKLSQEIKNGDILLGDDMNQRIVKNIKHGYSEMYTIYQNIGYSYTVTKNHTLVLYHMGKENKIIEITVNQYLKLNKNEQNELYGININGNKTIIEITKSNEREFFGWEIDKNNRCVLFDGTILHNCNNQQYLSDTHWMNGLKEWNNVKIVDKVINIEMNEQLFILVPYVPVNRFIEALNTGDKDWKNATCIFAHQEFAGCKMGSIISIEGDKWLEEYPEVISGHIHLNQKPQKNIYYPGSSMQHAFGESNKNIIANINFFDKTQKVKNNTNDQKGNNYDVEEINLDLPRKHIVYINIDKIEE